jgi:hypothetical protein
VFKIQFRLTHEIDRTRTLVYDNGTIITDAITRGFLDGANNQYADNYLPYTHVLVEGDIYKNPTIFIRVCELIFHEIIDVTGEVPESNIDGELM